MRRGKVAPAQSIRYLRPDVCEVPVSEREAEIDEVDGDTPDEEAEPRSAGRWFLELLRTWGPAILAIIVIRTFVFQPFSIPSTSMVPTLLIGDHVIVTKYSYGLWFPHPLNYDRWELVDWGDPKRGEIIVFRYPLKKSVHYIKRVVAIPGDRIEVVNNQIYLNGQAQERTQEGRYAYVDDDCGEPREANLWEEQLGTMTHAKLTDDMAKRLSDHAPITVPPGKVFVMGDNRDNSGDSREWGFVDEELIMGKAHFIWISFDTCSASYPFALRWDRMFKGLYGSVEPNR